jgi:hypothetical protein
MERSEVSCSKCDREGAINEDDHETNEHRGTVLPLNLSKIADELADKAAVLEHTDLRSVTGSIVVGQVADTLKHWATVLYQAEQPECLPPHDVCENSRDCTVCNQRIAPAFGVCFTCHSEEVKRTQQAQDDPKRMALQEIEAYAANHQDEFRGGSLGIILALCQTALGA